MKKSRKLLILAATTLLALPVQGGCSPMVAENVVSGIREGVITATTGILNGIFDVQFGGNGADQNGGSGNDLFIGE